MPSPVGHALAGVAVGWLIEGRHGSTDRATLRTAAAYAAVAAVPDLDLLLPFAVHRGASHGIGSALLVGLMAWAFTRRGRTGAAFAVVYASHILLDWLGTDTSPPVGLMALWPFSREYYESSYHVFMAVSRRYWLPEFWTYNLRVLVRELLILGPPVLIAAVLRGPRRRGTLVLLACALLQVAFVAEARAQKPPAYAEAIAKYRAGDFDAAVKMVTGLGTATLDAERRLLEETPFGSVRDDDVRAAIMLLTEAHFASTSGEIADLPTPHLDLARRLARRGLELLDVQQRSGDRAPSFTRARAVMAASNARAFVRRWYLLLASNFQAQRQIVRSSDYLHEARSLFADDPDILLASGAHHELLTYGSRLISTKTDGSGAVRYEKVDVQRELARASEYLQAAASRAPDLVEAHLRLGRVLHQQGHLEAAARAFDAARPRSAEPVFNYLLALFLGNVEEDRGAQERARVLYAEAIRAVPEAQAAFVGLSRLSYMDGRPHEAAAIMARLLERPADAERWDARGDPWWSYAHGEAWHFSRRRAELRVEVRR